MGSVLSKFRVEAANETAQIFPIALLPDDLLLFCLARLSWKSHLTLSHVCKQWRDMVRSDEWRSFRRHYNFDEPLIFALCEEKRQSSLCYVLEPNSSPRLWKNVRIPPQVSIRMGVGFETLGKNIYLLGGCDRSGTATDEVYCCHFPFNTWDNKTMPIARCFFASEVLDEKIYAIGGSGTYRSWDIYDPTRENNDPTSKVWISHEDPKLFPDIEDPDKEDPDIEDSVVLDGQIYIRCSGFSLLPDVRAIVYKPSRGSWQNVDANIQSGWNGPAVIIEGTLYVLDQTSGLRLMKWRKESKDWVLVRSLSQQVTQLTQPSCRLVAISKELFVIRKGLATLMFNVDQSENAGEMVESSIPKLTSDYDVISCKVLAV